MKSSFRPLLVLLIMMACSDSKETRMQRFLIQGNEKIQEQEYEQAERYYQSALKLDSCFADALNNLGTIEHKRKNRPAALNYYSRAISCKPDFTLAYLNRANVFYESNQPLKSLADLDQVEKVYPDTIALFHLRGLDYWKLQQYDNAIANFRVLLTRSSDKRDMLINIGTLHSLLKNYDSGRYYLNKVLALKSNDAMALNALAFLEADAGNVETAAHLIDNALSENPQDPYILNNKGYILLLRKQPEEAVKLINESISMEPYNAWAYRNKGIYYYHLGKTEESIKMFRHAERLDPGVDQLFSWLGKAYLKDGSSSTACEYFRKAWESKQITEKELRELCK